ncbi:hypothetical protein [Magnetospirillum sp. LM-5]|uniref:hypothetical protein n=1 Tax=Magnetospirillum sp. LM-5 TaxID=2681466 RepID=UPI001571436E|nr:hypothetical protein [Magnetospirillum sp. LM-5]
MARVLAALVPWISFWALVVLIAAHIIWPIGLIAAAALAASLGISVGMLYQAYKACD